MRGDTADNPNALLRRGIAAVSGLLGFAAYSPSHRTVDASRQIVPG